MATATERPAETLGQSHDLNSLDPSAAANISNMLTLRLSPELDQTVEALMRRTSLPKEDVFNLAIGLLKAATDAVDEGKRFGIAGEDAELEVEFTGF